MKLLKNDSNKKIYSCWLSRTQVRVRTVVISQSHSLNFLNCPLIWTKMPINKITKRENLSRMLLPPPFQPLSITEGQ